MTNEWKELDEQIQSLVKITTESLNSALLKALIRKQRKEKPHTKIDHKGSIDLLTQLLLSHSLDETYINLIMRPFHVVQTIRSKGVAHRKSSEFNKKMTQFGLQKITNQQKMKKLVTDLNQSLQIMSSLFVELNQ